MKRMLAPFAMAIAASTAAFAETDRPVVVELFVSQGCSACVPANAVMSDFAARSDVVALTYGVDYWDYLGWRDTLAEEAFVKRQMAYRDALGVRSVYTPQMIVDGRLQGRGSDLQGISDDIDKCLVEMPASPPLQVERSQSSISVTIHGQQAPMLGADVWLVRYTPGPLQVDVEKGENAGETFVVHNAVRQITHMGIWNGGGFQMTEAIEKDGAYVVLLQDRTDQGVLSVWRADMAPSQVSASLR